MRELQNCIERAVILTDGDTIHARHLNLSFRDVGRDGAGRREREPLGADRSVGVARRRDASVSSRKWSGGRSSRRCSEGGGNAGRAAEMLQISYKTLTVASSSDYGLDV